MAHPFPRWRRPSGPSPACRLACARRAAWPSPTRSPPPPNCSMRWTARFACLPPGRTGISEQLEQQGALPYVLRGVDQRVPWAVLPGGQRNHVCPRYATTFASTRRGCLATRHSPRHPRSIWLEPCCRRRIVGHPQLACTPCRCASVHHSAPTRRTSSTRRVWGVTFARSAILSGAR